ncbi:MAG: hypothetical protein M0031_11935 [Thermaerobacter sp.]|nr:hypothetical protein [Thermaerobacter sp.]
MIVRIPGEGQYRVDGAVLEELKALDERISAQVAAADEAGFRGSLSEILELVRRRGSRLDDASLQESDLILPHGDMTLAEARHLFET